jgi:hypothetical protein
MWSKTPFSRAVLCIAVLGLRGMPISKALFDANDSPGSSGCRISTDIRDFSGLESFSGSTIIGAEDCGPSWTVPSNVSHAHLESGVRVEPFKLRFRLLELSLRGE